MNCKFQLFENNFFFEHQIILMLSSFIKATKTNRNLINFIRSYNVKPWTKDDPRNEWEKMLAGDMYLSADPDLVKRREKCRLLMEEYNFRTSIKDLGHRKAVLDQLLQNSFHNLYIEPPIYFDYGCNTTFGKNCYMNYGCTILDVNKVTIGDNALFGPNVGVYTATHPTIAKDRISGAEYGLPIKIGHNCWLGANAVICPGVTIGDNVVVAAGAIVTRDVPSNVIVSGNPARILKKLEPFDYKSEEFNCDVQKVS